MGVEVVEDELMAESFLVSPTRRKVSLVEDVAVVVVGKGFKAENGSMVVRDRRRCLASKMFP